MKLVKKITALLKFVLKALLAFGLFIAVYFGVEYSASSLTVAAKTNTDKNITIYIQTNGIHTDLVLPIKNQIYNWSQQIDINTTQAKDSTAQFVAIGWGDKGFYLETPTWQELKLSTAFKAASGLSSTAMHCTFHGKITENKNRKKIEISVEQYKLIIDFFNNSFEWKAGQTVLVDTKVRYDNYDTFYEAVGTYSLFKTCNTWTNQALKAADLKACYWAAFEQRIMEKYE